MKLPAFMIWPRVPAGAAYALAMLFVVLFSPKSTASDTVTVINVAGMTKWLSVTDPTGFSSERVFAVSEAQTVYVPRGAIIQMWDDPDLTLGNGSFPADYPIYYMTPNLGLAEFGNWPESTFLPGFILGGTLAGWILYMWILTLVRRSVVET